MPESLINMMYPLPSGPASWIEWRETVLMLGLAISKDLVDRCRHCHAEDHSALEDEQVAREGVEAGDAPTVSSIDLYMTTARTRSIFAITGDAVVEGIPLRQKQLAGVAK